MKSQSDSPVGRSKSRQTFIQMIIAAYVQITLDHIVILQSVTRWQSCEMVVPWSPVALTMHFLRGIYLFLKFHSMNYLFLIKSLPINQTVSTS